MTETEKMRAILNERGVEYRDVNSMVTDIEHDGIKTRVYDYDDGPDYQLCVEQKWLTAEGAVRVALGIKPQEVLERRIDELCAEVEYERQTSRSRLERIDQLTDDNAKLIVKLNAEHIARQNVEIENAKLLRLLRALALCADDSADCDKCVMNGAAYSSVRQTFCDGMANELRAVGIEVMDE